jgi:protoheme IX farnesyltransferase
MRKFRALQELAKSGIVTLVLISVLAGYLMGHPHEQDFSWSRMLATLGAILLLASGSSALNQIQERHLDANMKRTAKRPLPSGRLSLREAWAFVSICLVAGGVGLFALQPALGWLGLAAVISYNGLYTLWWKKNLAFAAVPGAIPGALPILMGYVAASGSVLDAGGWYLFALLFFWQMPHFWVLALKFRDDYREGGFPTLPVARGPITTVAQIVIWCLGYVALGLMAPLFFKLGPIYWITAFALSVSVLALLFSFTRAPESQSWLRFFLGINFSLILYLGAAVVDVWSIYLIPWLTR